MSIKNDYIVQGKEVFNKEVKRIGVLVSEHVIKIDPVRLTPELEEKSRKFEREFTNALLKRRREREAKMREAIQYWRKKGSYWW